WPPLLASPVGQDLLLVIQSGAGAVVPVPSSRCRRTCRGRRGAGGRGAGGGGGLPLREARKPGGSPGVSRREPAGPGVSSPTSTSGRTGRCRAGGVLGEARTHVLHLSLLLEARGTLALARHHDPLRRSSRAAWASRRQRQRPASRTRSWAGSAGAAPGRLAPARCGMAVARLGATCLGATCLGAAQHPPAGPSPFPLEGAVVRRAERAWRGHHIQREPHADTPLALRWVLQGVILAPVRT